jgi:phosphate starvation-inducible PhoH-like protein
MRGRTLAHSFVILDEAQNCTPGQMKMCLTRLGEDSRMVVTGDLSQSDLPGGPQGLEQAIEYLAGLESVAVARFSASDVVRHALVTRIVSAYNAHDGSEARAKRAPRT